jgi:hypothetical protein
MTMACVNVLDIHACKGSFLCEMPHKFFILSQWQHVFQCSVFPKIALHYLWTNDGIPFCCQTFNRLKTRHGLEVSSFVQILVTYGHGKHLRTSIPEKPNLTPPFYFLVIKLKSSILIASLKYCGKGKVLDVLKLP